MNKFEEGNVVICGSQQAGTVIEIIGGQIAVLTQNGDIWHGPVHQIRHPSSQEELDACPIVVDRVEVKAKPVIRD